MARQTPRQSSLFEAVPPTSTSVTESRTAPDDTDDWPVDDERVTISNVVMKLAGFVGIAQSGSGKLVGACDWIDLLWHAWKQIGVDEQEAFLCEVLGAKPEELDSFIFNTDAACEEDIPAALNRS